MGVDLSVVRVPDAETVRAAEKLLSDALAGEIVGLAYVVLKPGGAFSGDVVGSARSHPIYTLGLARALEIKLVSLTDFH